ncbi:coiled-coil domain-containing protein 137 [Aplochiton taeniatus]
MGKNKPIKSSNPVKQRGKTGQESSNVKNKPHRDGKPKQKDHLEHIPFRLREIMKSKERMKVPYNKKNAKKIKEAIVTKPSTKDAQVGDIPVPRFRRRKKETEKAYIRRMENETQHVLFLTKNQIERQPELVEEEEEKPAVTKSDKKKEYDKVRLQRLHQKKLDRQVDMVEKEMFIDTVQFGEVAMAPPILSVKPRKAPIKPQGVSKGLLLNSLLGHTVSSTTKPSMARQRMMEEERVRVVEAYRHLKKQKQQQQDAKAAGIEKLKSL